MSLVLPSRVLLRLWCTICPQNNKTSKHFMYHILFTCKTNSTVPMDNLINVKCTTVCHLQTKKTKKFLLRNLIILLHCKKRVQRPLWLACEHERESRKNSRKNVGHRSASFMNRRLPRIIYTSYNCTSQDCGLALQLLRGELMTVMMIHCQCHLMPLQKS